MNDDEKFHSLLAYLHKQEREEDEVMPYFSHSNYEVKERLFGIVLPTAPYKFKLWNMLAPNSKEWCFPGLTRSILAPHELLSAFSSLSTPKQLEYFKFFVEKCNKGSKDASKTDPAWSEVLWKGWDLLPRYGKVKNFKYLCNFIINPLKFRFPVYLEKLGREDCGIYGFDDEEREIRQGDARKIWKVFNDLRLNEYGEEELYFEDLPGAVKKLASENF